MKKKKSRKSVEDRLDGLTSAFFAIKDAMTQQGFLDQQSPVQKSKTVKSKVVKVNNQGKKILPNIDDEQSETTIYHDAIEKIKGSVDNSDSEIMFNFAKQNDNVDQDTGNSDSEQNMQVDTVDTSDEMLEMNDAEKFIAECAEQARKQVTPLRHQMDRQVQPDKGEQIIKEAEGEQGRLFPTPGNCSHPLHLLDMHSNINHCHDSKSSIIDENYMVIGGACGFVDAAKDSQS